MSNFINQLSPSMREALEAMSMPERQEMSMKLAERLGLFVNAEKQVEDFRNTLKEKEENHG